MNIKYFFKNMKTETITLNKMTQFQAKHSF